jgi:O-antigen/teichoic acid export membrane protein
MDDGRPSTRDDTYRWLPSSIRRTFEARPGLARAVGNAGWLVAERVAVLAVGFFVNVWFVRHLGPVQYGVFSYAVNFSALFGLFASLGLDSIVVRELARAPEADGELLGTALALRSGAAVLMWVLAVGTVLVLRADLLARSMVAVLSIGSLAVAASVFDLWFQAKIASRGVVIARSGIFIAAAAVRCLLILADASLLVFGALVVATSLATAAAAYWLYRRARLPPKPLTFSAARARALLADGWPLIISSLSIVVYMKIDQVMLVAMVGESENGVYAVAVTLSEVWYFLPTAVSATVFPLVVEAYDRLDRDSFEGRMQAFYDGMAALGYAIAVPIALVATPLVRTLYGEQYARAGTVLSIHVISFLFVSLGVARGRFLMAGNFTRFAMVTGVVAAVLNVLLNLLLIPVSGAVGAAWSTLVSYAVANYFTGFLHPQVRRQSLLMTRAILVPLRPRQLVSFLAR